MSVNDFQSNTPPVFEFYFIFVVSIFEYVLANVDTSWPIYLPFGSGKGYKQKFELFK